MQLRLRFCVLFVLFFLTLTGGCSNPKETFPGLEGYEFPLEAGKYTILGIRTDGHNFDQALANAQDTITVHPDIDCMVGLWAYNPPKILNALKSRDMQGKVAVVGFDEDSETLQGIKDGHIEGTIVQQPFVFGYKSVEYLAAMIRDQPVDIPDNKIWTVPVKIITSENVESFAAEVERMRSGKGTPPEADRKYDTSQRVRVAFVTNSVDPFWQLAEEGCKLAAPAFNAQVDVRMPPNGQVEEQKRYIDDLITNNCQGLAISPIDPVNQGSMIDKACDVMPVICQDSDAPKTKRRFYLGTSNYMAGREAGKLVKKAIPDGGKVMIFVGKMEVLNAQERSRGVVDELMGKPIPPQFASE